ncbi:MAG TPA: carbamoyltransferase HypF [Gemmatimonadales bacterium]|nr:carbamoyltransferase HypF [Gemmatimonadales bacterium]
MPVATAARLRVSGVVQGVGFRPFVHRLAARCGLAGWVRNTAGEVQIEIEGPAEAIAEFRQTLEREAPPLARIERVELEPLPPAGRTAFEIRTSDLDPDRRQPVSPDVALCAACEGELFDPGNRRFRYPFITCTDCGPRFTVIEAMPYDRERTSMRVFHQCPECSREYYDPASRRYHSETNSCPRCGPRLWIQHGVSAPGTSPDDDPIIVAAHLLQTGQIVAVRGLGGFHLACDATNESAVRLLRDRKHREEKPFAVMVRTLDQARAQVCVSPAEARLLTARERPIVLMHRNPETALAPSIAPGLDTVGVMLAYTPLHHLLLAAADRPVVMTSGNASEEPIAIRNADALGRLAGLADALLLHDREITSRCDDSVLRITGDTPVFVRRARGYAPLPVELPLESPLPLVAVGAHLKNTFTLVHGRRAWVSQHIGDLENLETLEHFQGTLADYQHLFRVRPRGVVRDLHPAYVSSRIAEELGCERVLSVQHHHAHIAAVLAEHGFTGRALGLAFDGTGYGEDAQVWGGEFLVADLEGYTRIGHLRYAPLAGGDAATRAPWRVARGYLSLEPSVAAAFARAFRDVDPQALALIDQQITARVNTPLASSLGRLFDAAAAILGARSVALYEGQAAMELEALAGDRPASPLPFPVNQAAYGTWELDPLPLLVALGERRDHCDRAELAAAFHESVVAAAVTLTLRAVSDAGLDTVALGGGCFQNVRLLGGIRRRLECAGLRVLVPRLLPPNDGAISYGQAAVAAARLCREGVQ